MNTTLVLLCPWSARVSSSTAHLDRDKTQPHWDTDQRASHGFRLHIRGPLTVQRSSSKSDGTSMAKVGRSKPLVANDRNFNPRQTPWSTVPYDSSWCLLGTIGLLTVVEGGGPTGHQIAATTNCLNMMLYWISYTASCNRYAPRGEGTWPAQSL